MGRAGAVSSHEGGGGEDDEEEEDDDDDKDASSPSRVAAVVVVGSQPPSASDVFDTSFSCSLFEGGGGEDIVSAPASRSPGLSFLFFVFFQASSAFFLSLSLSFSSSIPSLTLCLGLRGRVGSRGLALATVAGLLRAPPVPEGGRRS